MSAWCRPKTPNRLREIISDLSKVVNFFLWNSSKCTGYPPKRKMLPFQVQISVLIQKTYCIQFQRGFLYVKTSSLYLESAF